MKQTKYIYKVINPYANEIGSLEEVLNTVNTDKILANVIELECCLIIVWEE